MGTAPETGSQAASANHPPFLNTLTEKSAWKHYEINTVLWLW